MAIASPSRAHVRSIKSPRLQAVSVTNLFELTNLRELSMDYRLYKVGNLTEGGEYDKNLNQLRKQVAYEVKVAVALTRRGEDAFLAIPATAPAPATRQQLVPYVATLSSDSQCKTLRFDSLTGETRPIAESFVRSAISSQVWRDSSLWGGGRCCYERVPMSGKGFPSDIDIFPGFSWTVRIEDDGAVRIAVDPTVCYVDHLWLPARLERDRLRSDQVRMKHMLYHFGSQWFTVQLRGVLLTSIAEHLIPLESGESASVFDYTRGHAPQPHGHQLQCLDPSGAAIVFRYPGKTIDRHGALALCKLRYSTHDPRVQSAHGAAVLDPERRIRTASHVVNRFLQGAALGGRQLKIRSQSLEVARTQFPVPAQRFGGQKVLRISRGSMNSEPAGTSASVDLVELGRTRVSILRDRHAGPLDATPFHPQYIIMPSSLGRSVNLDFERRFKAAVAEISQRTDYEPARVLYEDDGVRTLADQARVILQAVEGNMITRGYALLVLPPGANPDLHNFIKSRLWPDVQLQCATAEGIRRFYQSNSASGSDARVIDPSKLGAYIRHCALGLLAVNRKWLWALEDSLNYDVYVGIDVLNKVAGLTIVAEAGRVISFQDHRMTHAEKLSARQMESILVTDLKAVLGGRAGRPRSLVLHRDGRSFASEIEGFHRAVRRLRADACLDQDAVTGVVDLRKSGATQVRLTDRGTQGSLRNAAIGRYYIPNDREGWICTTGFPFLKRGTARPVHAVIVDGSLPIRPILQDIFGLSQLVFTAPDGCARNPITIRLNDDFLQPISATFDPEEAVYGDDEPESEALEAEVDE